MVAGNSLLVFSLSGQRYALPLACVQRTIRAVAITELPGAPAIVSGIIDLGGIVIPVVDLRVRFGYPQCALRLSDVFVIAHAGSRLVALVTDAAHGVIEVSPERRAPVSGIVPGPEQVTGVVTLDDGLVLIHDLDRVLSLDEDAAIARALVAARVETQEPMPDAVAHAATGCG